MKYRNYIVFLIFLFTSCTMQDDYDVIIRNGILYDGSGGSPYMADLAVRADKIAAIGRLDTFRAKLEIDADGLAVSPGFINMLSWATTSLIQDGRSLSDISQGVTLEVLGEGSSMGPLTDSMKIAMKRRQDDIIYDIAWTTLGDYLNYMVEKGVAPNLASFVGATTLRIHEVGYNDRPATTEELQTMCRLAAEAMEEGAVGVSSSLIYTPANFAGTAELTALAKVAASYNGMYISHIRGEGDRLLEALDEFLNIVQESGARGEIYHLKASGRLNWGKLDSVIARIETARNEGLKVTADIYTYPASSTGLSILLPLWVREGDHRAMIQRLQNPALRNKILSGMSYAGAGSPDRILLVGFRKDKLKDLTGKTLAEVAALRNKDALETALDLIAEDDSRIGTIYFSMSEENMVKKIRLPWMSFCSDAGSLAPEGVFLKRSTHPRAYGSFARLLAKYVREEKLINLPEAVRRLTSLPAENLHLQQRGRLQVAYFADIVIFDPDRVQDHATFDRPHQLATGVKHVFVNGTQVLDDGQPTGALPGRFLHGPGWKGK